MKSVIQRVTKAAVTIDDQPVAKIEKGMVVFLCVEESDTAADVEYMAQKLLQLRMFEDAQGKMNLSIQEAFGAFLVISQFTLSADCKKGRRPSFDSAARPEVAEPLYGLCIERLKQSSLTVAAGVFGAKMQVHLVNDGPVTFILTSR